MCCLKKKYFVKIYRTVHQLIAFYNKNQILRVCAESGNFSASALVILMPVIWQTDQLNEIAGVKSACTIAVISAIIILYAFFHARYLNIHDLDLDLSTLTLKLQYSQSCFKRGRGGESERKEVNCPVLSIDGFTDCLLLRGIPSNNISY